MYWPIFYANLWLMKKNIYKKNPATCLTITSAAKAMIIPIIENFTIFLPSSILFSSPAADRYINAPTTNIIIASIPTIPVRKVSTLVSSVGWVACFSQPNFLGLAMLGYYRNPTYQSNLQFAFIHKPHYRTWQWYPARDGVGIANPTNCLLFGNPTFLGFEMLG